MEPGAQLGKSRLSLFPWVAIVGWRVPQVQAAPLQVLKLGESQSR